MTVHCFFLLFSLSLTFCKFPVPSCFRWVPSWPCGLLSMFQATAPVSIPVGPELAGISSGNGIGPGTGTGNGISVSWQSPPVIFKGVPVSEALSHAFLKLKNKSSSSLPPCCFHSQPCKFFFCNTVFPSQFLTPRRRQIFFLQYSLA